MAGRKATTPKSTTAKKKLCNHCGVEKKITEGFYASDNSVDSFGRVSMCKECCSKKLDISDINTVKNVLNQINKPFLHDIWEGAMEEILRPNAVNTDPFGCYMKNLSLKHRGKSLTWKDSEDKPKVSETTDGITIGNITTIRSGYILSDEIIDKWGDGYTSEEYRLFEQKWNKLIDNYGEKTSLHTEGLITYIRFRVKEEIATAKNDTKGAKDWAGLAKDAAQAAKINVSQLSKSDISGGVDLMTQLYEAVESEVGIIPLLPRLIEQPYDDADMIIWSIVNYTRRLEDKPSVPYKEIWSFYDEMLQEHFIQQNFNDDQIKEFKEKRNNIFRDLSQVYKEPLYEQGDD